MRSQILGVTLAVFALTLLFPCTELLGQQLITKPPDTPRPPHATLRITADNVIEALYVNERRIKLPSEEASSWLETSIVEFDLRPGMNVLAVKCVDQGVIAGLLADIQVEATRLNTNESWRYSLKEADGWQSLEYDDSAWRQAVTYGQYPGGVWGTRVSGVEKPTSEAWWIWSDNNVQDGPVDNPVYFRVKFHVELGWKVIPPKRPNGVEITGESSKRDL